jgi:hypothetical protein
VTLILAGSLGSLPSLLSKGITPSLETEYPFVKNATALNSSKVGSSVEAVLSSFLPCTSLHHYSDPYSVLWCCVAAGCGCGCGGQTFVLRHRALGTAAEEVVKRFEVMVSHLFDDVNVKDSSVDQAKYRAIAPFVRAYGLLPLSKMQTAAAAAPHATVQSKFPFAVPLFNALFIVFAGQNQVCGCGLAFPCTCRSFCCELRLILIPTIRFRLFCFVWDVM